MCTFLLILKGAVRYGAIEMTALLLQVLLSFRLIIVSLAVVGTVGGEEREAGAMTQFPSRSYDYMR